MELQIVVIEIRVKKGWREGGFGFGQPVTVTVPLICGWIMQK